MECEQSSTFDKERYGWGWTKLINDWHVSYCVSLRSIGFGLFSFGFVLVLFFNFLNFSFFLLNHFVNSEPMSIEFGSFFIRWWKIESELNAQYIYPTTCQLCMYLALHSSTSYATWTSQCFVHEPTIETKERETESRKHALCRKLNWYIHVVVIYMIMMRC